MAASDDLTPLRTALLEGQVIPAHPLALTAARKLDERRQAALTRYYCEAGAGGIAVGVHTTQFAIRDVGLLEPVLRLARRTMDECTSDGRALLGVAGVCGPTPQARQEAELAREIGYDAVLLSLGALRDASNEELLAHAREIARVRPLFGFYLQPAVGGRALDRDFWKRFLEIEEVVAIKVAPFDRYRTLEVARALAESGRSGEVALYTGNDDAIVVDLLSELDFGTGERIRFAGGLLGQWAVWTRRAVQMLEEVRAARGTGRDVLRLLTFGSQLTEANAAVFDARNGFAGCIPGIHEVLRRQGLLAGRGCLDPSDELSPGQAEEIDRVLRAYPHLGDDDFVAENVEGWLG
jgi:dihydrodipicolinate synthase/N-acetylneuraminate lyase